MTRVAAGDAALRRLAARVAVRLRKAGETIVTAESCTGGLRAKCMTDLAGSSDYFERGWVTYSNEAKQAELGVPSSLLARFGAVSEEVALHYQNQIENSTGWHGHFIHPDHHRDV